jgi:hypothetical protein
VAEIKVGGVWRTFIVTPRVLDVWMKKHSMRFDNLGDMTMEQQSDLIWLGFQRGEKGKEHPLKNEVLDLAMDTEDGFEIIALFQAYLTKMMGKMSGDDKSAQTPAK